MDKDKKCVLDCSCVSCGCKPGECYCEGCDGPEDCDSYEHCKSDN